MQEFRKLVSIQALIKDMHNKQTTMERQLLNVAKGQADLAGNTKRPTNDTKYKHRTGVGFMKPTLMTNRTVIILSY